MTYFYWYFGIGVVVLLAVFISHRLSVTKEGIDLYSNLESLSPDKDKWHYKLREKVLFPLSIGIVGPLVWPLLIYWKVQEIFLRKQIFTTSFVHYKEMRVTRKNLIERKTVTDIEAGETVTDPLNAAPSQPFGHLNSTWENFKEKAESTDEFWTFEVTLDERWHVKKDYKGYAIVRGNDVIEHFLTSWIERKSAQQDWRRRYRFSVD